MKSDPDFPGLELPPRPQEPVPGECCGRGCHDCVYILYEDALQRWEEKVQKLKEDFRSDRENNDTDPG